MGYNKNIHQKGMGQKMAEKGKTGFPEPIIRQTVNFGKWKGMF
jgi:hypothetical protein